MFDVYHRKNKEIEDLTAETSQLQSEIVILKREIAELQKENDALRVDIKTTKDSLLEERKYYNETLTSISKMAVEYHL